MILEKLENLKRAEEILDIRDNAEKLVEILQTLDNDLTNTKDLFALSAQQIGHNIRLFALKFSEGNAFFINPLIKHKENPTISREKCITCGEQEYLIPRYKNIEVIYTRTSGYVEQIALSGGAAYSFQQMFDLLDGIQLSDYGLPIDDDFDKASDDEKREVIEEYLKALHKFNGDLNNEIENDDEMRDIKHTIEFYTGVATGEIELKKPEEQVPHKPNRSERRRLAKEQRKRNKQLKKEEKSKNDRENKD